MTMGIRKMPEDDWLIIDNLYHQEQDLRRHLLKTDRDGVMQCLPGAEEACKEALQAIVDFLIRRYPSHFHLLKDRPGYIYNAITDRSFKISVPLQQHPLEIAAQLVMEDINLLMQGVGEHPNEYYLCVLSNTDFAKQYADVLVIDKRVIRWRQLAGTYKSV